MQIVHQPVHHSLAGPQKPTRECGRIGQDRAPSGATTTTRMAADMAEVPQEMHAILVQTTKMTMG